MRPENRAQDPPLTEVRIDLGSHVFGDEKLAVEVLADAGVVAHCTRGHLVIELGDDRILVIGGEYGASLDCEVRPPYA